MRAWSGQAPALRENRTQRRRLTPCKASKQEQQEPFAEHSRPHRGPHSTSKHTSSLSSNIYGNTMQRRSPDSSCARRSDSIGLRLNATAPRNPKKYVEPLQKIYDEMSDKQGQDISMQEPPAIRNTTVVAESRHTHRRRCGKSLPPTRQRKHNRIEHQHLHGWQRN